MDCLPVDCWIAFKIPKIERTDTRRIGWKRSLRKIAAFDLIFTKSILSTLSAAIFFYPFDLKDTFLTDTLSDSKNTFQKMPND